MWWLFFAAFVVLWLDSRYCTEFKKHKLCIKELHERVEALEKED